MKIENELLRDMAEAYPDNKKIQENNKIINANTVTRASYKAQIIKDGNKSAIREWNAHEAREHSSCRDYITREDIKNSYK